MAAKDKDTPSVHSDEITQKVRSIAQKPPGRPLRDYSAAERAEVYWMAANGSTVKDIAKLVGCSEPTLRKHCQEELERGRAARNVEVRAHIMRGIRAASIHHTALRYAAPHWLGMTDAALLQDIVQQAVVAASPMTAEEWKAAQAAKPEDEDRAH